MKTNTNSLILMSDDFRLPLRWKRWQWSLRISVATWFRLQWLACAFSWSISLQTAQTSTSLETTLLRKRDHLAHLYWHSRKKRTEKSDFTVEECHAQIVLCVCLTYWLNRSISFIEFDKNLEDLQKMLPLPSNKFFQRRKKFPQKFKAFLTFIIENVQSIA